MFSKTGLPRLTFFFGCTEQREGSLVPGPGIEPTLPAKELQCPSHWTAQEAPGHTFEHESLHTRAAGSLG